MASFFDRQASMASLPPDEVEFELDLEVSQHPARGRTNSWIIHLIVENIFNYINNITK